MISREKVHSRLISEGEFVTENWNPYPNTHCLISRSVASVSENWTRKFSSPRNESGIRGSGGMGGGRKDETIEMDGFESGKICRTACPNERPRTIRSALNTCRACGSQAITRVWSEAEGIKFNLASEWVDITLGISAGFGSPRGRD